MVSYSRSNLLIPANLANVLQTQPITNGQLLYYDAKTGTYYNDTRKYDAQNVGSNNAVPVFKVLNGNTFEFHKLKAGSGISLVPTGDDIVINSSDASAIFVVDNIAARDAMIPSLQNGSLVFVKDTGNGSPNAYGFYMWIASQSAFSLIGTKESALVDANTFTVALNYNSPVSFNLGMITAGHRAVDVAIRVLVPFNGSAPVISVGDDNNGSGSIIGPAESDLKIIGQYSSESTLVYTGNQSTIIKAYYDATGSTVGQAQIILSYV